MSNYRAGDIIRMTREFVGMSREKLSDEICSVQTLYRIESGKTRVKRTVCKTHGKNGACTGKELCHLCWEELRTVRGTKTF